MALISKSERYSGRDEKVSAGKLHATQYLVVIVLCVLASGMWRLQIVGADSYRVLAEANRIRKDPVRAPRGKIFDREGRIMVDNYPSVSCYLLREQVKENDAAGILVTHSRVAAQTCDRTLLLSAQGLREVDP